MDSSGLSYEQNIGADYCHVSIAHVRYSSVDVSVLIGGLNFHCHELARPVVAIL